LAASVFSYYGVNFYSRGERSLEEACAEDQASMAGIIEDLSALTTHAPDFKDMSMPELTTYILRTHHAFARRKIVFIHNTLDRLLSSSAGDEHLLQVRKDFNALSAYLTVHMKHEEFVVFPFIMRLCRTKQTDLPAFRLIDHPFASMRADHQYEASLLKTLSQLTDNYDAPPHADYALKLTYSAMKELEEDLKIHMHLENNILFPEALELASSMSIISN
ncbi:MAG: hemerythrin domain-containing protein, partial [Bacteroidota bacterium]|nr:hemerythrin domain-containing protein [Bacteroidota bacterium]